MIRLSLLTFLPCLSRLETLLTIIDNFSNKCQIKIGIHCVLGTQLSIIVQCKNWSAPERSSALFYLETSHFLRFSWSEISEKERPESGIFLGRQGHGRQGQGKNRYTILICLPKLGQAEMTCSLIYTPVQSSPLLHTTLHLGIGKPQLNNLRMRNKYQKVYLKQIRSRYIPIYTD